MELLKKIFNNDTTVIGLCDLKRKTLDEAPNNSSHSQILTSTLSNIQKVSDRGLNSQKNFFMANIR